MAIDNTPPRLKLIVTIAIITVITLIGINFVLESYFAMMTDQAQREKLAPTRDRDEQRKSEQLAFANAAVPLDKAISELSKGERPSIIMPEQSDDIGSMTGWSKLPKPAPVPQPRTEAAAAPTDDAGAPEPTAVEEDATAGDAGAQTAPTQVTPAPAPIPTATPAPIQKPAVQDAGSP